MLMNSIIIGAGDIWVSWLRAEVTAGVHGAGLTGEELWGSTWIMLVELLGVVHAFVWED